MDVTEKLRFRVASFQSQGGPSLNYILCFSLYSGSLLESINSFGRCLVKSSDWMKSVQRTFSHKLLYNLVSLPKQRNFPHTSRRHSLEATPYSLHRWNSAPSYPRKHCSSVFFRIATCSKTETIWCLNLNKDRVKIKLTNEIWGKFQCPSQW